MVHPGVGERQGPHGCTRGDLCEGCERCLTPSAQTHWRGVEEAHRAKSHLFRITRFLEQQAEHKLKLTGDLLKLHCNHPNVIGHYPHFWSGERTPTNYF